MNVEPGKYIVAVSGGVDSIVLLNMLSKQPEIDLVVAHFDHGIRENSAKDAKFVGELAESYHLPFETERVELGPTASEAEAREARYSFLKKVQQKHHARAIITAHHRDDLLETSIINMLRGTGRRGLHSLKSHNALLRPLLHLTKVQIHEYAKAHDLKWREDSTNLDTDFLRNKIRLELLPRADAQAKDRLLNHIKRAGEINEKLDQEIDVLLNSSLRKGHGSLPRRWFIMLPHAVAGEVVSLMLRKLEVTNIDKQLIEKLTIGIKTARPGKKLDVDKQHFLMLTKRSARIMNRESGKTVRV